MRKFLSLLMVATVATTLLMAGCGDGKTSTETSDTTSTETSVSTEPEKEPVVETVSPLDLYKAVWASYAEEEMYPMAGGDFDHSNMENPDEYDITANKDAFLSTFIVPEDVYAEISGNAVTAMHMMNTNTFCSAMFTVKDASKIAALADAYKAAIQANMWMCGMPDTVVVMSVGDVMIVAYGEDMNIQIFKNNCLKTNANITVLVEAPAVEG